MIPNIYTAEDSRRGCYLCNKIVEKGEDAIAFGYDAYNGNIKDRSVHIMCWLSLVEKKMRNKFFKGKICKEAERRELLREI